MNRSPSPQSIPELIQVQYDKHRDYYDKYYSKIEKLLIEIKQEKEHHENELRVFDMSETFKKNCAKQRDQTITDTTKQIEKCGYYIECIQKVIQLNNQFENYDIYMLKTFNIDGIPIEYVSIDNIKLSGYNNIYLDDVHPIEHISVSIAIEKLTTNKSGIIVDILSNTKTDNIPDIHTIVLYKFNDTIYIIDPNNSDFSGKLKQVFPSLEIQENGKLYSCEKGDVGYDKNYRHCTDISLKILSCLMKVQNEINKSEDIAKFVENYTRTEFPMMHSQLKFITQASARFTTPWVERVKYFNNYIVDLLRSVQVNKLR